MKILDAELDMREGQLCPSCQVEMAATYLIRTYPGITKADCDRCGKTKPITMRCRWMLNYRTRKARGLE